MSLLLIFPPRVNSQLVYLDVWTHLSPGCMLWCLISQAVPRLWLQPGSSAPHICRLEQAQFEPTFTTFRPAVMQHLNLCSYSFLWVCTWIFFCISSKCGICIQSRHQPAAASAVSECGPQNKSLHKWHSFQKKARQGVKVLETREAHGATSSAVTVKVLSVIQMGFLVDEQIPFMCSWLIFFLLSAC